MSLVKSGNAAHDSTCSLAEGVQQGAVAAATTDAAGALIVKNANIAFHRSVIASAKLNLGSGIGVSASIAALRELGVNS
jgi:hypothetical protein